MLASWGGLNSWGAGVIPVAPIGTTTIGTISVTETTASAPFTYDNTDFTYFEYQLDSGTITTSTSPIDLTGLIADSAHSIKARAVKSVGSGEWSDSVSFTTEASVTPPTGGQVINCVTVGFSCKVNTVN